MKKRVAALLGAVGMLVAAAASAPSVAADDDDGTSHLESTIAFASTRDNPTITPRINASEVYLMRPDGSNQRRLTENAAGDGFAVLSPDGKRIIFDSNRNIGAGEPLNITEMFLMKTDGREQTPLLRGGSASWSPDSKNIAFHRSASGTGLPVKPDAGAATTDSDIFVMNMGEFLEGTEQPRNLTNNGAAAVDDDPDWSPAGDKIVFTRHDPGDEPTPLSAEVYVMNADGTGVQRLTDNSQEERSPDWSPDGERLAFSCHTTGTDQDHEICVMNADGTGMMRLTDNTVSELAPSWSPNGERIAFQRPAANGLGFEIWSMNPDGTDQIQLSDTPGPTSTLLPNWGELRVRPKDITP
jgi:dipeptidyl aminopeptidase/acylaminoacyl peptidase